MAFLQIDVRGDDLIARDGERLDRGGPLVRDLLCGSAVIGPSDLGGERGGSEGRRRSSLWDR